MGYRMVSLTYREVHEFSLKIACFLEAQNINSGDKVLLLAPNSPYWICVFWGTVLRGAVLVPLNIQSTSEMVEKVVKQTGTKIIFKFLNFRQKLPAGLKVYDIELISELATSSSDPSPQRERQEEDLIQIMYTSGTTGEPKGVMHTNKNLISNVEALSHIIPITSRDKFLSILPLSHVFEQVAGFLVPFRNGAEIIYAHSPAAIKDLMQEYRVTHMAAVPEFLRIVMSKIEARAGRLLKLAGKFKNKPLRRLITFPVLREFGSKFHTVASGGAPLDPELEKKWEALGITLLQGYGLTETSPVISTNTYQDHKLGSVGKVLSGVKVKIAADGEILTRGPNVFRGYYKNEEKTREAFTPDGWLRTGDIGELDQDGFLFLRGRKKYMILGPGGQNVYPEDIEFELNKISGVKDSCVVGLEKPGGPVEIHGVLLLSSRPRPLGGEDKGEGVKIIEEANRHLASYQQIQGFTLWPYDDFPRSATRKVKKQEVLKYLKTQATDRTPIQGSGGILEQILSDITGVEAAKIHKKTKIIPELNLDSLLRVELVTRLAEKFQVEIDEAKIAPTTTVAEVETLVKNTPSRPAKKQFKTWPLKPFARIVRDFVQRLLLFPFVKIFAKLEIRGAENLKNLTLPAIFMPNHLSFLDSLAVAMAFPAPIRKTTSYAAAKDVVYGKYKALAWFLELFFNAFSFPRREQDNIKAGLEYLGQMLDHGYSVVIYPEGRQSPDGTLQPLKRGAGLMAVEMGCAVVPVKIGGTNLVQPRNKILPQRRGMVEIKFGGPLKFSRKDSYIAATERIEQALRGL